MRAAVFHGTDELELVDDREQREPGPGELLLRIAAATVCGTDLRILRGEKTSHVEPPVVLGHELAGHVEQVGKGVEGFEVGALVGVAPLVACGWCVHCRADRENACLNLDIIGYNLDGGLAEYVTVPERAVRRGNVVAADDALDPEQLCLAEPLSCCLNGHERSRVAVGDTVLILGAGPIGLLHTQLARRSGASKVIVSEPLAERRRFASELGADVVVDPESDDLAEAVATETDGLGPHATVIAIGIPALVSTALELTRVGGTVNIFAGLAGDGVSEVAANLIHYNELVVTGVTGSRRRDYALAVQLIERGEIDVATLLTDRFLLSEAEEAIAAVERNDGIKTAVVPSLDEER